MFLSVRILKNYIYDYIYDFELLLLWSHLGLGDDDLKKLGRKIEFHYLRMLCCKFHWKQLNGSRDIENDDEELLIITAYMNLRFPWVMKSQDFYKNFGYAKMDASLPWIIFWTSIQYLKQNGIMQFIWCQQHVKCIILCSILFRRMTLTYRILSLKLIITSSFTLHVASAKLQKRSPVIWVLVSEKNH